MHNEIKEFWEKLGEVDLTPSTPVIIWVVKLYSNGQYITIAETINDSKPRVADTTYFYDDISYTEDEMLKLIKLKAFI